MNQIFPKDDPWINIDKKYIYLDRNLYENSYLHEIASKAPNRFERAMN